MSIKKKNKQTSSIVTAMTQDGNCLRGVRLKKQSGKLELLWTRSNEAYEGDYSSFAAECGLTFTPALAEKYGVAGNTVVGFDSSGVVFYRISVPAVNQKELASVVRLQAESRLPLPAEKMEISWRAGQTQNGRIDVTIAAAKKESLGKFVENVNGFKPAKIILDCEGVVKAWRELFSGTDEQAVILSVGPNNTRICLALDGRLTNTLSLDMGTEDFSTDASSLTGQQFEATEMFAQDARRVLELFGFENPRAVPVFVLSEDNNKMSQVINCLESVGMDVRLALPEMEKLKGRENLFAEQVYEYRVPIGLGLMALDGDAKQLTLFEHLYSPARDKQKKFRLNSLKVAATIAAAMIILLTTVFYAADVAGLRLINKYFKGAASQVSFDQIIKRNKLIKTVAQQRPDLLALLNEINSAESQGIKLNSFDFKKGKPVSITGEADKTEGLYDFQKTLQAKKNISDVKMKIQSKSKDEKDNKINFSITFHYKSFTEKISKSKAKI